MMQMWLKRGWICAAVLAFAAMAGPAMAAVCQKDMAFERWLEGVKQEAVAQGVSQTVIASALPAMVFDPAIVRRDRGQGVFQQSFLQFSDRMATPRVQSAQAQIRKYSDLFARIERQYGVPAPVLAAFWGLESDYGSNNGKFPILRAVTTLAYDCRRPDFFRRQLIDALRIIQRGDLKASEMIGDWAGELGAMQFTPSDYYKYAVDYDGDGRRDLVHSVPDTLASAANFLAGLGWQRGQPWLQEVRVPTNLPWDQADLEIQHPRSQWVNWGVTAVHGGSLPADNLPASLLLPMGRFGPAFLAYPSFKAFLGWNAAMVYSTTAAYLATRIAGAPPVSRGNSNIPTLTPQQIADLQRLLAAQRFGGGEADGKIGSATRTAVKKAQMKYGLPADSYPTAELLERMRGGR
jgi:lytic murein transglycosylase